MIDNLFKILRKVYNKFIHGIAFVPALIGIAFLSLAVATVELDKAGVGRWLNNNKVEWLQLKDAETARIIISTVAAGIISLTVFSFSMVMVVMNQAASQMSNRVLDNIIGNKVQKIILGFYIGTIGYSLFLLTTISEAEGANIPVLSIYILLCLTVVDIFLFIYFLHYITQSIRYEQLIKRIHDRTYKSLSSICANTNSSNHLKEYPYKKQVPAVQSGYFQSFSLKRLLTLCREHDIVIEFLHTKGTFILKNIPFLNISSASNVTPELLKNIFSDIDIYYGQEVDKNPYYGFHHLTEVGVKALSPGINDPGTAVLSLNAISDLLLHRMQHIIPDTFEDEEGVIRVVTKELSFTALFEISILPIWDYGRKDRMVQKAMIGIMNQFKQVDHEKLYIPVFDKMIAEVEAEQLSAPLY